uniref:Uncharacterized protein n=1 Tax=Rhizophora mucronata TaxID=61149 RepID=A0A2P2PZC6_RHIMU
MLGDYKNCFCVIMYPSFHDRLSEEFLVFLVLSFFSLCLNWYFLSHFL